MYYETKQGDDQWQLLYRSIPTKYVEVNEDNQEQQDISF
jgi:hypothetical protein